MMFQFPEHWIPVLGKRIKNIHFKEFTKKGTDHSLESFRPLLDGTTNWPGVMEALDQVGYRGLSDVRVLPSLPALPRSPRLPDQRRIGPNVGKTSKRLSTLITSPNPRTFAVASSGNHFNSRLSLNRHSRRVLESTSCTEAGSCESVKGRAGRATHLYILLFGSAASKQKNPRPAISRSIFR